MEQRNAPAGWSCRSQSVQLGVRAPGSQHWWILKSKKIHLCPTQLH